MVLVLFRRLCSGKCSSCGLPSIGLAAGAQMNKMNKTGKNAVGRRQRVWGWRSNKGGKMESHRGSRNVMSFRWISRAAHFDPKLFMKFDLIHWTRTRTGGHYSLGRVHSPDIDSFTQSKLSNVMRMPCQRFLMEMYSSHSCGLATKNGRWCWRNVK